MSSGAPFSYPLTSPPSSSSIPLSPPLPALSPPYPGQPFLVVRVRLVPWWVLVILLGLHHLRLGRLISFNNQSARVEHSISNRALSNGGYLLSIEPPFDCPISFGQARMDNQHRAPFLGRRIPARFHFDQGYIGLPPARSCF